MNHELHRRTFLGSAAALGAAALPLASGPAGAQPRPPGVLRLRVGVTDPRARLDVYAKGVAEMKRRSAANVNDPTGWTFQARIHGSRTGGADFNKCQHAVWWFLPWHRAYLYFFERIVGAASGEGGFNLPYWDWNTPRRRSLPAVFRDRASTLYDDSRLQAVNQGRPLSSAELDLTDAFRDTRFESQRGRVGGFGGSAAVGRKGRLEQPPHDSVHVFISGNMGLPATAALDPIFWLHHCNVDRLWSAWLARRGGRENPTDAAWKDKEFSFFDEQGRRVVVKAGDFAGTTSLPLGGGYVYDNLEGLDATAGLDPAGGKEPAPRFTAKAADNPERAKMEREKAKLFGDKMSVTLASPADVSTVLAEAPVTLEAKLPEEKARLLTQALGIAGADHQDPPQVVLTVRGVKAEGPPGVVYRVFLNRPKATAASDTDEATYVGSIALFQAAAKEDGAHAHAGGEDGEAFSFDITEAVRSLQEQKNWDPNSVKVTLVPSGVGGENAPKAKVTFKGVAISVER